MAKRKSEGVPAFSRLVSLLPEDLAVELELARANLRAAGLKSSSSAIVEVALRELLKRRDLAEIVRRHGVRARRDLS